MEANSKQYNKTVLALWHTGGKGKTGTIREFAKLLLKKYPLFTPIFPIPTFIPPTGDFRLVVEINGIKIGIESKGDPSTDLEKRLFELADIYNCTIIICSTRVRGDTVDAVNKLHSLRGFQRIRTSTYQLLDDTLNRDFANELKAKHIMDLINSLSII